MFFVIINNAIIFCRILSPVDGKAMEGTQSEKAPHSRDFEREGKVLKCTEVSKLLQPFYYHLKYCSVKERDIKCYY